MAKGKGFLELLVVSGASLFTINKVISENNKKKNSLNKNIGDRYLYKYGDVHFTKKGSGSPLLLIHDLDNMSSAYEWKRIRNTLAEKHTVYTIDLLGCGLSEKPNLTYTTFFYVELVHHFVEDIIKEPVTIITSHDSATIGVSFNKMYASLCSQLILINPCDLNQQTMESTQLDMVRKNILFSPLVGTTLYNFEMQESKIKTSLKEDLFLHPSSVEEYLDGYYEAAHTSDSKGRYLYACKKCKYTNSNMNFAIQNKTNIKIIQSDGVQNFETVVKGYTDINPDIKVKIIQGSKLLPQIETPELLVKTIQQNMK